MYWWYWSSTITAQTLNGRTVCTSIFRYSGAEWYTILVEHWSLHFWHGWHGWHDTNQGWHDATVAGMTNQGLQWSLYVGSRRFCCCCPSCFPWRIPVTLHWSISYLNQKRCAKRNQNKTLLCRIEVSLTLLRCLVHTRAKVYHGIPLHVAPFGTRPYHATPCCILQSFYAIRYDSVQYHTTKHRII